MYLHTILQREISREGISFHSSLIIRWKKDRFERESSMFSHTGCMHRNRNVKWFVSSMNAHRWIFFFLFFFFLRVALTQFKINRVGTGQPGDISPWTGMCTMRVTRRRNEAVVTVYCYASSCLMWSTLTISLCRERVDLRKRAPSPPFSRDFSKLWLFSNQW